MSAADILSLLPMVILAGGILLTLILIALRRSHLLIFTAAEIIILAAIVAALLHLNQEPQIIGDIIVVDRFGLYYQILLLSATLVISIFSYISLERLFPDKRKEEYYVLLMLATLGSSMMVISTHFISFFVSIEVLTISLYTLISYYRERDKAIEAGLKYLVLAAMSSAFLLFGMALIYAVSGQMSFHALFAVATNYSGSSNVMLIAGAGLMIVGIGFKLALVPFHMWAPDVYEGASSPVSAFVATVSKGGVVALLLRFFTMTDLYRYQNVMLAFTVIALLSMLAGNLLALQQRNVKRLLAYSSIAHLGYLLVAFIAGKGMGVQAATFYITIYMLTILGAFGVVTILSKTDSEADGTEYYKGLFWRRPLLAALFTLFLLSLAGIPLTAGFIGKYFLLTAGLGNRQWLLAFVLVASSVIGLFYYLRLIVTMISQDEDYQKGLSPGIPSKGGLLTLMVLGILVLGLGLSPGWLIDLVRTLP
ncbi:NADH-quinone oxidoreductase subunit N [Mucilaginibacter sp. X4EP1]|uniref:NADH-quinone oxidoreductase subunit N n=1 Tax=Mucilaginibacter sp. X4EP1 TaxID=2723092 RepID=UPI00216745E6|nr:NADH-quinone oxidoreductase subunit N [Mucilaginibacter sp. X4EP1]MCS3812102.1 NADH-quinone oxidoreductase subunit N [Mucilaginibacter sp. X4EP1]